MAKNLQVGVKNNFGSAIDNSAKEVQLIFCTRTHSQISQIINEIKKTNFSDKISVVPIISRKGLCVHEKLKETLNVQALNDKC
jgi:chromosome transmission fidelity protein 1